MNAVGKIVVIEKQQASLGKSKSNVRNTASSSESSCDESSNSNNCNSEGSESECDNRGASDKDVKESSGKKIKSKCSNDCIKIETIVTLKDDRKKSKNQ